MFRTDITPLILTYNEEVNLGRVLESLDWADQVVVLDSGSTDRTREIACSFPNVDWRVRPFDNHGAQWAYGIHETGIESEYVLALDADMIVPRDFLPEFEKRFAGGRCSGGMLGFRFRSLGRLLMGTLYPPQLRLFRRREVDCRQVGHTQAFSIKGPVHRFRARLIHDDRKSMPAWVRAQLMYAALESHRIESSGGRSLKDRIRKTGMMPFVVGILAYASAGGPLRGKAALQYGYERFTFECLLAMALMKRQHGEEYPEK